MRYAHLVPSAVALACVFACGVAGAAPMDAAPRALAPETAAALLEMPMLNAAGEGRRLFLKLNCYGCHGVFAGGGIGPDIVGASHAEVEQNVLDGNDFGMPSFAKYVDETDIDNITTYLASIGTKKEPMFMDWWKKHPKK